MSLSSRQEILNTPYTEEMMREVTSRLDTPVQMISPTAFIIILCISLAVLAWSLIVFLPAWRRESKNNETMFSITTGFNRDVLNTSMRGIIISLAAIVMSSVAYFYPGIYPQYVVLKPSVVEQVGRESLPKFYPQMIDSMRAWSEDNGVNIDCEKGSNRLSFYCGGDKVESIVLEGDQDGYKTTMEFSVRITNDNVSVMLIPSTEGSSIVDKVEEKVEDKISPTSDEDDQKK